MPRWRKHTNVTGSDTELRRFVSLKATIPWLSVAKEIVGGIPVIGGAVQGSIGALIEVVQMFDNVRSNRGRQQALLGRINTIYQIIDPLTSSGSLLSDPLLFRLEKLLTDIYACKPVLERLKAHSRVAEFFQREAIKDDLDEINNVIEDAIKTFHFEGAVRQEVVLDDLVVKVDNINAQLADQSVKLGTHVVSATFMDSTASKCLDGTRVQLLQQLHEWSYGRRHDERRVAWVYGPPGSGKSTVAQTVAAKLDEEGVLAASFFFSRHHADRRNAYNVFPSIARQLSQFNDEFRRYTAQARGVHSGGGVLSMEAQLQQFIADPLQQISSFESTRPWIIVLDALDECDDRAAASEILELIGLHLENLPHIRFLITSRPEHNITSRFQKKMLDARSHAISLYEIDQSTGASDIARYVDFELGGDWAEREGWFPAEKDLQSLVDVSSGLFIYAATCVKLVKAASDKAGMLRRLTQSQNESTSNLQNLNALYLQIIDNSLPVSDEESLERLRRILGAIVHLRDPINLGGIAGLLGRSEDEIITTLYPLQSVILVPKSHDAPIQFYHLSFRDFLVSHPKRLTASRQISIHAKLFLYDQSTYDTYLSEDCFKTLNKTLHFNMSDIGDLTQLNADIPDLGPRLDTCLPPSARYACLRWASHLSSSYPIRSSSVCNRLERWARKQMMFWLEALSLLGELGRAVASLSEAEKWYQKCPSYEDNVLQLLKDGQRFVLTFFEPIESGAGHIYHSALPFTPESKLLSRYESFAAVAVKVILGRNPSWHPLLWSTQGHNDSVWSSAFSPDGKKIVSGSYDKTVRMWSSETGKLLFTLKGHTSLVTSVAFSPDGKQIVSGSYDDTVRLWTSETGKLLSTLKGHTHAVVSVAFSPDGRRIVSRSLDSTVRMWSLEAEKLLATLECNSSSVTSVSFSPDGNRIVSGSSNSVRMWSENGKLLCTLEGHRASVTSVAFSQDGKQIVSGSKDNMIRVWSTETRKLLTSLEGHTDSVMCVAFSPDGKQIVSGSDDKTVRVWSSETGKLLSVRAGHTSSIRSVAFSSDGERILSASQDSTVRMWSSKTGKLYMPEAHTNSVTSVAISSTGKRVASASDDSTVRIWSSKTGSLLSTLEGHKESVTSVAFSPDGKQVVSGSEDKMVRVWSSETGVLLFTLEGHTDSVWSVALSPDGKRIVSGGNDSTLRIWSSETGKSLLTLNDHFGVAMSVAFSPDGKQIVSGSYDGKVRLWTITGELLSTLRGHINSVMSVTFSQDGRHIESLDASGRSLRQRVGVEEDVPHALGSPDNLHVAENGWVTDGNRHSLCWIPFQNRPARLAMSVVRGHVLSFGSREGIVSILDFSPVFSNI